jgi:hypothetical protein
LDDRTPFQSGGRGEVASSLAAARADGREDVGFASRRAERGKMQLWLTTFTAAAAIAILVVVSMSVLHAG